MGREYSAQFQDDNYIQRMKLMSCFIRKCWSVWAQQKNKSKGNLFFIEVENNYAREIVMNKESGLPESSKVNKKSHGMGLTNIQRCARKYKGDIDIVIGTSKQEQQILNLTVMLNGKPVGA